jgi:hypothetical protein
MNAMALYRLIFKMILNTIDICRFDSPNPSVWWDGCGARMEGNEHYERGREMLIRGFMQEDVR